MFQQSTFEDPISLGSNSPVDLRVQRVSQSLCLHRTEAVSFEALFTYSISC